MGQNLPSRDDDTERHPNDTYGRQINSRETEEEECGYMTGIYVEVWKSVRIDAWLLAPKEGISPHVLISPLEVYEILMDI